MGEGTALPGPHTPRGQLSRDPRLPHRDTQTCDTHTTGAQGTAQGPDRTHPPREPRTQVGTWRPSWFRLGPHLCCSPQSQSSVNRVVDTPPWGPGCPPTLTGTDQAPASTGQELSCPACPPRPGSTCLGQGWCLCEHMCAHRPSAGAPTPTCRAGLGAAASPTRLASRWAGAGPSGAQVDT